jgi:hypothetical protein
MLAESSSRCGCARGFMDGFESGVLRGFLPLTNKKEPRKSEVPV